MRKSIPPPTKNLGTGGTDVEHASSREHHLHCLPATDKDPLVRRRPLKVYPDLRGPSHHLLYGQGRWEHGQQAGAREKKDLEMAGWEVDVGQEQPLKAKQKRGL